MNEVGQRLLARVQGVDALRWSALAGTLGFGALVTLFVGGDAVTDPGGWAGIGGTAVFVLVVGALCLLAWYHPRASFVVLAVAGGIDVDLVPRQV